MQSEIITGSGRKVALKPEEMWPDGKVRPHAVKTGAGETVWLTDAEFDVLLTEARHKHYANKRLARQALHPDIRLNDIVLLEWGAIEPKPYCTGKVLKVKADGALLVSLSPGAQSPNNPLRVGGLVRLGRISARSAADLNAAVEPERVGYLVSSLWQGGARLKVAR